MYKKSIVWIRRDLRLQDHAALSEACKNSESVYVVFILDQKILEVLPSKADRRLTYIHEALSEIDQRLRKLGSQLITVYGDPQTEIPKLADHFQADAVFCNEDYETSAIKRDRKVQSILKKQNRQFHSFKDHIIFTGPEVRKSDDTPYKVFTPYKNAWISRFKPSLLESRKVSQKKVARFKTISKFSLDKAFSDSGFIKTQNVISGGEKAALSDLKKFSGSIESYDQNRDFPALSATSSVSPHLRFGTLSIRAAFSLARSSRKQGYQTWMSELIWREFYSMILQEFPQIEKSTFKPELNGIKWPGRRHHFEAWKNGKTGYPIVDAGMRQLKETGLMHNRVRMITASFLVKDLLVDWRKGEKHFADLLLDFDLASNNGGWQWCASTGCDAQPYFRIFNPESQTKRFDKDLAYIKKWIPEFSTPEYPSPIVDHSQQRKKALLLFENAKKKAENL